MNRLMIVASCCLLSFCWPTAFLGSQPVDKKPDEWIAALREDQRLKVGVSYSFKSAPTAEELLAVIQKATGVPLSLAAQPDKGKLNLATTQGANVPACTLMELVAL